MKALLLSAGLGTRLRPYTLTHPKPTLPLLNLPLLHWSAFLAEKLGASEFVVNTSYLSEQIKHTIGHWSTVVEFSHEGPSPLGSGGGIWKAKKFLQKQDDFLVLNADEALIPIESLNGLADEHRKSGAIATICCMQHPEAGTKFGAVWTADDGSVVGFGKAPLSGKALHYVGIMFLSQTIFDFLPNGESNILYDAVTKAMQSGEKVRVAIRDMHWYETGNPADFLLANKELLKLLGASEPAPFLIDLIRHWPHFSNRESVFLGQACLGDWHSARRDCQNSGGELLVGNFCRLQKQSVFEGYCTIGDSVEIGSGSHLKNCVVLAGAKIAPGSFLSDAIVG